MSINYKYHLIDMYIKSIGANIKYKVISGAEEFGILLYKNFKKANLNIDFFFDDYNYINQKNLSEIEFISLEKLKEISDNTFIFISDRDPDVFETVYQKLKDNGIKYICPSSLMKIIRFLPEVDCNLYPVGHYFSLYPDIESIKKKSTAIFDKSVVVKDIDFNEKKQLEILNQMTEMYPTLPDWKYDRSASLKTFRYNYKNQWFGAADAVALHCMLRILKLKNFIEVGSGYSSAVTLDTNEYYFENKIKISFIEPYPERLKMLLRTDDNIGLQVKELQDIPLNYFEKLEEGDILFIDSSHVSKVASDVNYLIFEVFPRLNKGVYIHFHDIFYPFEYPEAWITNNGFIWNELYILRAFLQNNKKYSIQFFQSMLQYKYKDIFDKKWPKSIPEFDSLPYASSIWIKKEF